MADTSPAIATENKLGPAISEAEKGGAPFTAGPWTKEIVEGQWWISSDDRNVGCIFGLPDHPLNIADACLFETAPDLYMALKEYLAADIQAQETVGDRGANDRAINRLIDARHAAAAAIARAESQP